MSGKFQKKKKKKSPIGWLIVLLILAVALVVVMLLVGAKLQKPQVTEPTAQHTAPAHTVAEEEVQQTEQAEQTEPAESAGQMFGTDEQQPNETQLPIDLGEGLVVTKIASYAGLYLEDGTDEVVSGIMMIELENTSELDLQLAKITLEYGETPALFTVSNLPAGKKVVLLEQTRMPYTSKAPEGARVENTVFLTAFEMHEDALEIIARDGVINVKNISGADIEKDIFIYYKNISGGVYYGGITYRARIEGGLKSGEIRQIITQHYDADGSEILMVSYG